MHTLITRLKHIFLLNSFDGLGYNHYVKSLNDIFKKTIIEETVKVEHTSKGKCL